MNVALPSGPRLLEVCSGVSGLGLGLRLVFPGARTLCHIEREAFAAAALVARMEAQALDQAPIWDDLASFPSRDFAHHVDIVAAGIPCQPFSVAGQRRGTADERWLWPDLWRSIRAMGPRILVLENVPGLVVRGLTDILSDLATDGWSAEWDVFSAAQLGAPQLRERFFLVAHTGRLGPRRLKSLTDAWGFGQADAREGRQGDVADAEGVELEGGTTPRTGARRSPGGRGPRDVADPYRQRLEGGWWGHLDGFDRPDWPPLPGDLSSWGRVPPDLKPAFCLLADGLPAELARLDYVARMDQLHALGNAAIPVVTACAVTVLLRRLLG
jgi:DNA (cytosine-5)-methyltransferase 1